MVIFLSHQKRLTEGSKLETDFYMNKLKKFKSGDYI